MLRLIEQQRNGHTIDLRFFKTIVNSFASLSFDKETYKEDFGDAFMNATENYYREESESSLAQDIVVDYLRKAEERFKQEVSYGEIFLDQQTHKALVKICEDVLIREHCQWIWENFQNLLDNDHDEGMQRMYTLLSRIPEGLEPLRKTFEEHVKQAISKLTCENAIETKAYVDNLLDIHQKNAGLVARNFQGDADFATDHAELMWEDFQNLLDFDEHENLEPIYVLLSQSPKGLELLRNRFEKHTTKAGLTAVSKLVGEGREIIDSLPKAYIDTLLEVHRKNAETVTRCFQGDVRLVASLDMACQKFINQNAVTGSSSTISPELLAKYADTLLRKNNKVADESQLEDALNGVVCT
jgi:hypothetical protein